MTHDQAQAYNMAIQAALDAYKDGKGAIAALRIPFAVTVEHTLDNEVIYDAD